MVGILSETGSQGSDLYARLNELEWMVQRLMGGAPVLSAASASLQPLAPDYHRDGLVPVEPAARPSFGSVARAPFDSRHSDAGPRGFDSGRAKLVRRLIRKRRQRDQFFPSDLFADPAWDMMLDLYAAHYERREISVSSLCIAAAVPATTALRWIKTMVDDGRFVRVADPDDGRRIIVSLADDTRCRLDEYFDNLED
ncbi:hypothetical protein [Sphingopyxis sp. NJF-3]